MTHISDPNTAVDGLDGITLTPDELHDCVHVSVRRFLNEHPSPSLAHNAFRVGLEGLEGVGVCSRDEFFVLRRELSVSFENFLRRIIRKLQMIVEGLRQKAQAPASSRPAPTAA